MVVARGSPRRELGIPLSPGPTVSVGGSSAATDTGRTGRRRASRHERHVAGPSSVHGNQQLPVTVAMIDAFAPPVAIAVMRTSSLKRWVRLPGEMPLHWLPCPVSGPSHDASALPDEPDAPWAVDLRLESSGVFLAVARRLGAESLEDDPLLAAEAYRRILAEDPYDDDGHQGLVAAFEALGAHRRSEEARRRYYAHMTEIGLDLDRIRGHSTAR